MALGEVRLIGARLEGSLDLTGASLHSTGTGLALDLGEAVIDGSVFLIESASGRPPDVRGRIDMDRARIGGQFLLRNAKLHALQAVPVGSAYSRSRLGGTALSAPRLSVPMAEAQGVHGTGRPVNAASRSIVGASALTGCGSANRPARG